MKLCKDCKHCEAGQTSDFTKCFKNTEKRINLISGEALKSMVMYCHTHRGAGWLDARLHNLCGKEGRWYEPK
jgi:hypothetical protein